MFVNKKARIEKGSLLPARHRDSRNRFVRNRGLDDYIKNSNRCRVLSSVTRVITS